MTNLDRILEECYAPLTEHEVPEKARWPNRKSGWLGMTEIDATKYAKTIQQDVDLVLDPELPETREALEFSIVDRGGEITAWRKEEALERLIIASNLGTISNQFVLSENVRSRNRHQR
jgi:hypothetical protein